MGGNLALQKKKIQVSCSHWLPTGKHWQILHCNLLLLLGTSSQLYVNDWCHNLGCRCLVYHIVCVTCMPTTVKIINNTHCKNCFKIYFYLILFWHVKKQRKKNNSFIKIFSSSYLACMIYYTHVMLISSQTEYNTHHQACQHLVSLWYVNFKYTYNIFSFLFLLSQQCELETFHVVVSIYNNALCTM